VVSFDEPAFRSVGSNMDSLSGLTSRVLINRDVRESLADSDLAR
jgi:hypothetical protein